MTFQTTYAAETKDKAVPQLQLTVTQDEINVLKRALDLAAGTCQKEIDGCLVGASRSVLLPLFDTAKPVFQDAPK